MYASFHLISLLHTSFLFPASYLSFHNQFDRGGSHAWGRVCLLYLEHLVLLPIWIFNICPFHSLGSPLSYHTLIFDLMRTICIHNTYITFCYLIGQDWGQPGDLHDLRCSWHIPSAEEKQWAVTLLRKFLLPELGTLDKFTSSKAMARSVPPCSALGGLYLCVFLLLFFEDFPEPFKGL